MNVDRFRVRPKDGHALRDHRPDETPGIHSKKDAREKIERGLERLRERQELLYAQDRYALLLVFQGMDGAGKDSAIKHVLSGVSPQSTDRARVQGAVGRRAGSRLSLAREPRAAGAREDRDLQPVALRGSAHGPRASAPAGGGEAAARARDAPYLGRSLQGHHRLRTVPAPERDHHPQVLPAPVARRAAAAHARAARRSVEELEVFERGSRRSSQVEGVHVGAIRRRWPPRAAITRPGT